MSTPITVSTFPCNLFTQVINIKRLSFGCFLLNILVTIIWHATEIGYLYTPYSDAGNCYFNVFNQLHLMLYSNSKTTRLYYCVKKKNQITTIRSPKTRHSPDRTNPLNSTPWKKCPRPSYISSSETNPTRQSRINSHSQNNVISNPRIPSLNCSRV